jgi:hypothetical protein
MRNKGRALRMVNFILFDGEPDESAFGSGWRTRRYQRGSCARTVVSAQGASASASLVRTSAFQSPLPQDDDWRPKADASL